VSVVCLGEALIDLSPPPGSSLMDTDQLAVRIGGAPLNVAIHLKRSGIDSRFLGTLSSDGFGDRIRALLDREGVDRYPINPVDAPTRLAVIDRQDDKPPFKFYGNRPADTHLSSLLMTDQSAARVQEAAIQRALAGGSILIFSDPNPRPFAWPSQAEMVDATELLIRVSRLTKLSLDDARALGWPVVPGQLTEHLKRRTSGSIVITDGKNGSWFEDGSALQHVPASPMVEVDPTGAGDAFFATVIEGMLQHGQLSRAALRAASDAGAATAARHGAH
jgi:fructokinase